MANKENLKNFNANSLSPSNLMVIFPALNETSSMVRTLFIQSLHVFSELSNGNVFVIESNAMLSSVLCHLSNHSQNSKYIIEKIPTGMFR